MKHRFLLLPVAALVVAAPAVATTYMTPEQARALMFPGASFTPAETTLTPAQVKAIEAASGVDVRAPVVHAWRDAAGNTFILDQVLGKHEFITYALGIDAKGAITAVEVLQYDESYGDQIRNAAWRAQFTGQTDGGQLKLDHGIRNISGATLSCKHVTDGIRRLLATYDLALRPHAA